MHTVPPLHGAQADRDRILADIRSSMGAPRLNMYLKDAIVGSAQAEAERLQRLHPRLAPPPPVTPPEPCTAQFRPAGGQAGTDSDGSSGATAVVAAADATGTCSTDGEGGDEGQDGSGDGSAAAHELAEALSRAGRLLMFAGRLPEAEPYLRHALAVAERAAARYGSHGSGSGSQAAGASWAAPPSASPAAVHDVASHADALAVLLKSQARWVESEALFRRALAAKEAALGAGHPEVLTLLNNLGSLMQVGAGREGAGGGWLEAVTGLVVQCTCLRLCDYIDMQHVYGAPACSSVAVLTSVVLLAGCRRAQAPNAVATDGPRPPAPQDMDRLDDAEALLRRVVAAKEGALGPAHPSLASSLANLGLLLQRRGRWDGEGQEGRVGGP